MKKSTVLTLINPKFLKGVAHRGLHNDKLTENSVLAFDNAIKNDYAFELDVHLSKDKKLIVCHDSSLKRITNKDGIIEELTLDEIKNNYILGDGSKIPTLEELMQLIQSYGDKNIVLNIETKSYPDPASAGYKNNADPKKFVEVFNNIVKKYDMEDRVVLQSFDWQTLIEMKKLNPNISTSALWQEQPSWGRDSESLRRYEKKKSPWLGGLDIKDYQGNPVKAAHAIGADIISPYYTEISKQDVDEAHSLGMKVVPWTVNNEKDMNMLLDMGVDGIISDKPWLLKQVLEKRNIKLHTPTVNVDSPYHTGTDHKDTAPTEAGNGNDAAY